MPTPARKPRTGPAKHRSSKVTTRHILDDLDPALRETAVRMSAGDLGRIRVLSRSRFEIDRSP